MPQNRHKRRLGKKGREDPLDRVLEKRGPGRPGVNAKEIRERGDDLRLKLLGFWETVRGPVLKAETERDVRIALAKTAEYNYRAFVVPGFLQQILKIIHEPRFPKRSNTQVTFLADSLAGFGKVSPRRSRDICAEQRAKDTPASQYQIIRKEFYVECTCGYKGPALDNACRKCGAVIPDWLETGKGGFFQ